MDERELELRIEELSINAQSAHLISVEARWLASPEISEDGSASDRVLSKSAEKIETNRRAFLINLLKLGATASISATFGALYAHEFDRIQIVQNFDKMTDAFFDEHFGHANFSAEFIEEVRAVAQKQSSDIDVDKVKKYGRVEEIVFASWKEFASGNYIAADQLKILNSALRRSSDSPSQLILAELISANYVRGGLGTVGSEAWRYVNPNVLNDDRDLVAYSDKSLNLAYTSLEPTNALEPSTWNFDKGLHFVNRLGLDELGITTYMGKCGFLETRFLGAVDGRRFNEYANRYGVKGFYLLMWAYQHAAASLNFKEITEISKIQYRLLKKFARKGPQFTRPVWNMAFIIALQLHRQWERDGTESIAIARDRFLDICLDDDQQFWGTSVPDRLGKNLNYNEVVPISLAVFLNSTPALKGRVSFARVPHMHTLGLMVGQIRPQRLKAVLDLPRKIDALEVTDEEICDRHALGDATLGIYVQPIKQVRGGLTCER